MSSHILIKKIKENVPQFSMNITFQCQIIAMSCRIFNSMACTVLAGHLNVSPLIPRSVKVELIKSDITMEANWASCHYKAQH